HQPPGLRLADRPAPDAGTVHRCPVARARRGAGGRCVPGVAQCAGAARAGSAGGVMRRSRTRAVIRLALAGAAACAMSAAAPSAWRTHEIYMAHFAITDVQRQRFRFAHKLSRAALGLAGAQAAPLHVWIDDWSLEGATAGPTAAGAEGAAEAVFAAPWRLRA